jgi:ankyrin repeat protein
MDSVTADRIKAAIMTNDTASGIALIDTVVKLGFNVNDPLPTAARSFENNWSLMFWASLCDSPDMVTSLVDRFNARVNIEDSSGYTPLLLAAFHGKFQNVKALVERGANIQAVSKFGETLEDLVLRKPLQNDKEIELREYVQKLLRKHT